MAVNMKGPLKEGSFSVFMVNPTYDNLETSYRIQ
jgi:hypothetical protein